MQPVTPSSTDVSVTLRALDSTTFLPYESLTSASTGLALWYRKGSAGAVTAITESDLAAITSVHSDGGIKHADDGVYRLDLPDAAIPTAENEVTTYGGTATGYIILGGALIGKPVEVVSGSLVAASVTGAVGSMASGGITAASIATGAIDADAIAADAVTEIQSGLATAAALATVDGIVDDILVDTAEIGAAGAGLTALATAAALATVDTVVDSILADTGTDGVVLSAATLAAIADVVLRRTAVNIEASVNGDTLDPESLYGLLQAAFNSTRASTVLTIRKTDNTTLGTRTLTVDDAADPVTGVTD